jgi:DNA-3-methyladenine glycosylase I
MESTLIKKRCFGDGLNKNFYAYYHDFEWGIPVHDDRLLFEMLVLEGTQAGLSWETILKRRQAYRTAFHNFDPTRVATMSDKELDSLLHNPELIRNRLKMYSARQNACVFLKIQQEFGSFDAYVWGFVHNQTIFNRGRKSADSPEAVAARDALSKDLKKRGMNFVGPIIIYAYMQAIGMMHDHAADCWLYKESAV